MNPTWSANHVFRQRRAEFSAEAPEGAGETGDGAARGGHDSNWADVLRATATMKHR